MNPWLCPISSFAMRPVDTGPRRSAGQAGSEARPGTTFLPPRPDCSATVLPARFAPTMATAETAAAARRLWTRLIHGEVSAANLRSVERGDRVLRLLIRAHLYEPKAASPAGRLIAHDLRRFHRP